MTGKVICWAIIGVIAGMGSRGVIGGQGYGLFADIFLGILGAAFGGWTAKSFPTSVLTAALGAVALIWLSTRPAKDLSRAEKNINQKLGQ